MKDHLSRIANQRTNVLQVVDLLTYFPRETIVELRSPFLGSGFSGRGLRLR